MWCGCVLKHPFPSLKLTQVLPSWALFFSCGGVFAVGVCSVSEASRYSLLQRPKEDGEKLLGQLGTLG